VSVTTISPAPTTALARVGWTISDILTVAQRNILKLAREPASLTFMIVQPVMFVLLFRYVFGGAIGTPPQYHGYVNYFLPGILVQTTLFGSIGTAIGLAEDMQAGFIERFRALPMARMAFLAGRTVSELMRNVVVIIVITAMGLAVGFRPGGSPVAYAGACLLMLIFAYCLSWAFAFIGLSAPSAETAQAMAFPLVFPLTFASSIFVPVASMPGWLRGFATYQPVSATTAAVRGLMTGTSHGINTWTALAWSVGIMCVLAPLSVRAYRHVR
jgi:ABC-2 type transport system permease protein/oleandomycin transport system permease protein